MEERKRCSKCGANKPIDAFHRRALRSKGKVLHDGTKRQSWCKDCTRAYGRKHYLEIRERHIAQGIAYRRAHPEQTYRQQRRWRLRSLFGLTPEEWEALFENQGRVCAICHSPEPDGAGWHTDHDHSCCPGVKSCGKCIRGILCYSCNSGLGKFADSPELLTLAASYISAARSGENRSAA